MIPVYQTFPIFAAFMAALFLDERLAPLQWAAVVVTVAGAVLLSVQRDEIHRRLFLHRSFLIVMLGSVVAASAFIVGSIALEELPVINTHALRNLGLSGVLLAVSLRLARGPGAPAPPQPRPGAGWSQRVPAGQRRFPPGPLGPVPGPRDPGHHPGSHPVPLSGALQHPADHAVSRPSGRADDHRHRDGQVRGGHPHRGRRRRHFPELSAPRRVEAPASGGYGVTTMCSHALPADPIHTQISRP